jgi:tRNA A37 threonylcarbamoyladenosine biosynthesis protein TsaE
MRVWSRTLSVTTPIFHILFRYTLEIFRLFFFNIYRFHQISIKISAESPLY